MNENNNPMNGALVDSAFCKSFPATKAGAIINIMNTNNDSTSLIDSSNACNNIVMKSNIWEYYQI